LQLAGVIAAQVAFAVTPVRPEDAARRAEEQQRRSEERLRFALEASSMATWDWHVKRARARSACVSVGRSVDCAVSSIEDDGCGIQPSEDVRFALATMRERAKLAGGDFEIAVRGSRRHDDLRANASRCPNGPAVGSLFVARLAIPLISESRVRHLKGVVAFSDLERRPVPQHRRVRPSLLSR